MSRVVCLNLMPLESTVTGTPVDVGSVKRTIAVFDALSRMIKRPVGWDGYVLTGADEVAEACRMLLALKVVVLRGEGDEAVEAADGCSVLYVYGDPASALEQLERDYLREGWRYLCLYAQAALDPASTSEGEPIEPGERAQALSAVLGAYITGTCATAAEIEKVSPLGGRVAEFAFLQLEWPSSTITTNALADAADAKDRAIGGLH